MPSPTFLGLGAQKSATSWIFACLYDHPEVCCPVKERHFFDQEENWQKGITWYESLWQDRCTKQNAIGEYGTTLLDNKRAIQRIHAFYPQIKLLISLRNPMHRAFSNYLNDKKAGQLPTQVSFEQAFFDSPAYKARGQYKQLLNAIFEWFPRHQVWIVLYDDILQFPEKVIQSLYQFIGVDTRFQSSYLHQKVNTGKMPKHLWLEQWSNQIAHYLQQSKIGEQLWWSVKRSHLPTLLRRFNQSTHQEDLASGQYQALRTHFIADIAYVKSLLQRPELKW